MTFLLSSHREKDLCLTELGPAEIAAALGLKPFQGKQIFAWIHRKRVFDFAAMTDLSKALRRDLAERCQPNSFTALDVRESSRGDAKKVLLRLMDGETIESVLLRDRGRTTLCLSTQVGCPLNCTFCATGRAGFVRNLSPGEIVEQALALLGQEEPDGRTPNIVYMGMGEPFLNYDAVKRSIELLMCPAGLGIGARKITVSTVGDLPGIARFANEKWQVRLSISLHAANDSLRSALVPLNTKYPLAALMNSVAHYVTDTGRAVSFEWVLLDGVNDSLENAAELADLVRDLKCSVHLIPYNAVPDSTFRRPSPRRCKAFRDELARSGIRATLRYERGGDIEAACGQLRRRYDLDT